MILFFIQRQRLFLLEFLIEFLYTNSMKNKNILKYCKQWTKVLVHIKGAKESFVGKVGLRDGNDIYYVTNPVNPWLTRVHIDDIVCVLA